MPATIVNIHEAKTQLSQLLVRISLGEEIVIAKAGTPIARLIPITQPAQPRVAGSAQGQIWISPDFDAPLPDELLDAFDS
ncbi:MAG: type II toxin-antitoxin system Phd/YefM family antitoxin [Caldilineaceae bacterium]